MQLTATTLPGTDALTVAVLVDNEVLSLGIAAALGTLPTVSSVHNCGSRSDVEDLIRSTTVDALIGSPGEGEWMARVRRATPAMTTRVLVLVDESSAPDPTRYASIDVDGFLSQQDMSAATLRDALHRALRGDVPMPPALTRALLARAGTPAPVTRPVNLTSREVETLLLMARGLSNKQIARYLTISSHGAKRLVGSIMLKLDSPNRTTAVVNAIKAGIVEPQ